MDQSMETIQIGLIYICKLTQFLYAFNINKICLYSNDYYRDFLVCYSNIFDNTNDEALNDDHDNYETNTDQIPIIPNNPSIYYKITSFLNKEKSL